MAVKAKAPPPPVVYDWSGAYVGFNIGGMWSEVTRTYPNLGLVPLDFESKGDDVIYGFHAGAQGQWGNWVLGIEAAYSAGSREMQSTVALPIAALRRAIPSGLQQDHQPVHGRPAARLRCDRWMVYGTGGYAVGGHQGPVFRTPAFRSGRPSPVRAANDGWFAGGGLEYMVHKGALVDVVFGAEYQHFDLRTGARIQRSRRLARVDLRSRCGGDIVRARLTIKTQGYGWWGRCSHRETLIARAT